MAVVDVDGSSLYQQTYGPNWAARSEGWQPSHACFAVWVYQINSLAFISYHN